MDAKRLADSPTIADTIVFDILTPDADGCFTGDPYKVDSVTIYYVRRTYSGDNFSQYDKKTYDDDLKADLDAAIAAACASPTDENLAEVEKLRTQLDVSAVTETFYYSNAEVVAIFGNEDNPAWLSSTPDSPENALINIDEDEEGNPQFGHFELYWQPVGMREGDYFICWTWTPLLAGDKLHDNLHFTLLGSTLITTSIPTHFTDPQKYEALSDRYLPEMFKLHLSNTDLTPEVMHEFNAATSKGFTFLEDMANQIIDLIDGNAVHESLLPLLGGFFNLQLRTGDPTLWRRQIKNAVPLYKKKGTYSGLSTALNQIGVNLTRFAQLWQVVSKYTYQEAFTYTGSNDFELSRTALLPVDTANLEIHRRNSNSEYWDALNSTYVSLVNNAGVTTLTWIGSPALETGDEIRVVYEVVDVPSPQEQVLENYIRSLPLADQRDWRDQEYPLKNWNVRVIEDDDPLINSIIPLKNPYHEALVYGKVRTEFPYSENIYNMEEYNGSIRDSSDPCDIDKDFMDGCNNCIGSKFVVDLDIENLSHDRIIEAIEVIGEYVPFHAVMHSMNLSGTINEFVPSAVESYDILISAEGEEFTVAGGQTIFSRTMEGTAQFKRDELANMTTVVTADSATAYNEEIALYSPNVRLDEVPIDLNPLYNYLEIMAPSSNAGTYTVDTPYRNHAFIASGSPTEPLDQSAFTFRLSNERGVKATASIYQDDVFTFSDAGFSFWIESLKTQWDVDNDPEYLGGPWIVDIPAYSDQYEILNILTDGTLLLDDPSGSLPTSNTSGISYTLKTDALTTVYSGTTGKLAVKRRGRVDVGGSLTVRGSLETLSSMADFFDSYHENGQNHYVSYGGTQYLFDGLVEGYNDEFYISGYTSGDVVGSASIEIYHRLLNNQKGYFHYQGLKLVTLADQEVALGINNGENAATLFPAIDAHGDPYTLQLENNRFKENFLIVIGTDYYAISKIDGVNVWISGPQKDWKTTGTALVYDVLRYDKLPASVPVREYPPMPGHDFDLIDRRNETVIDYTVETDPPLIMSLGMEEGPSELGIMAAALNSDGKPLEMVSQEESITFSIKIK